MITPTKRRPLMTRHPDRERIVAAARAARITLSAWIRRALDEQLAREQEAISREMPGVAIPAGPAAKLTTRESP